MSWNRSHRGTSIGRVLHFLYYYCGFDVAQLATVGNKEIIYHGKVIATYEWLSDLDIPYFTFLPNLSYSGSDLQAMYTENQNRYMVTAIREAEDTKPKECNECRVNKFSAQYWKDCYMNRGKNE